MTITGKQIAMARILLDLSQVDLAQKIGVARKTIMRIENGQSPGSTGTIEKIQTFFEHSNLHFTAREGVERSSEIIRFLEGAEGFRALMNDVYETAKNKGGEICLYNAKPSNWYKWLGKDWYIHVHNERMKKVANNIDFKITVKRNDRDFIAQNFAEYRWFPEDLWNEQSYYAYGDKLAFLNFEEEKLKVLILEQAEFTQGFKNLFNIAWNRVAIKPPAQ